MNYGQRIAELRKKKNLTQAELGAKLNVTAQAISKWENNLSEPDLESIKMLCELFEISVDTFLGLASTEPDPTPDTNNLPTNSEKFCENCNTQLPVDEPSVSKPIYNSKPQPTTVYTNENYDYFKADQTKIDKRKFFKGLIWGGITFLAIFFLFFFALEKPLSADDFGFLIFLCLGGFCVTTQKRWETYLSDILDFFCRSFRAPFGLIFELSLDGIIWFLTVKLLMFVVLGLLSILWFIVGMIFTFFASFFTFPFALAKGIKSIKNQK